ncbi:MAG: Fe(3+) dicitrate transport protein [Vicingaceae bacterium]|jgi:Fe(3+) dicitrate transport protein
MKKAVSIFSFLILICCSLLVVSQNIINLDGVIISQNNQPVHEVVVYVKNSSTFVITDEQGKFTLQLPVSTYTLSLQSLNIVPIEIPIKLMNDTTIELRVKLKINSIEEVVIQANEDPFGIRKLRPTEDGGLYEGKKTEVINIEKLIGNKASNNARQAFSKIPSLNIWESDNAGLQLDIGGRGLSPKRTSNFNTRQNGYDISADALGYPESYYTPPLQAVQQIEVVRGAGALQYGSQFGGLVNFKMRKGNTKKRFNFETENTYGANNFFNTFNSFHGQVKKLNYYSYVQYKRGDGWRVNSNFEQVGAFVGLEYAFSNRFKLSFDYTNMHYLSQQAGGLTDTAFEINPKSSNRERNWFRVNWNLAALQLEYQISENAKLYSRTFGLLANRTSLGVQETPDLADPLSNRDLIDGSFKNIGNETRFVYQYKGIKGLQNTLLVGTRLYRGLTNFSQGFGTTGSVANFAKVDTSFLDRRRSDFEFPNLNAAVFIEKIVKLSTTLSLIPGLRFEHIETQSQGYFTSSVRINSFGDFIEERNTDSSKTNRNILLYGLGVSKQLGKKYKLYANATANYRAINFTDVQIQTNTQVVDPNIKDESGYNFDLGIRKMDFTPFFVEASLFYTLYENRIGQVIDDGLRLRTNIGSATIFGFELYFEVDVLKAMKKKSSHKASVFFNGSVNRGVYSEINDRALVGVRAGNKLEDLPQYNIKSGITYGYKKFSGTLQGTFIGQQFSDAANTEDAFKGVFGPIPAYTVFDLSANYKVSEKFSLASSINNLTNNYYFTRRATGYPGPGIIPALGRTWNLTLKLKL